MLNEISWVEYDDAVNFNRVAVEDTGEAHVIRDVGLLLSALDAPKNTHLYGGVDCMFTLASNLCFSIARNHPFIDGNKRTAFTACEYFLYINGYNLQAPDVRETSQLIIDVITRDRPEGDFIDFLRKHTVFEEECDDAEIDWVAD